MKSLDFSFIIPVFNRPLEIKELLDSFTKVKSDTRFEIVIIEDGSSETSKHIIEVFKDQLQISYYFKPNSGPGDSRNYGMRKAKGNYFIILDSDVIMPTNYLVEVKKFLNATYVDCFGGPDADHPSFSNLQKAINFSMTSFITTGGVRGHKKQLERFQPRSFNMGISKKAFEASGGFGHIHPGEDPDLSLRLWDLSFKTALIKNAIVYHKRRISWKKFHKQVHKFGLVRPIINSWHPKSKSILFWFPTCFSIGLIVALILSVFKMYWLLYAYGAYFSLAFFIALFSTKSIVIGFQSLIAILIQFFSYGFGFLKSSFYVSLLKRNPETVFPHLFFKING